MQTIGERLEEARKRKGISIREASEATKIRSDYLQRFEGNVFDINLPDIYVRGFLRTYAQYLKLNSEKLLVDYSGLGLGSARDTRRHQESREIMGRLDLPDTSSKSGTVVEAPAGDETEGSPSPRSIPTAVVTGAPSADRRRQLKLPLIAAGAVVAIILLVFIVRAALSGSSDTPPVASQPPSGDVLQLIAIDNVQVKVTQVSDRQVLFSGDLVKGDTRFVSKDGKVSISYNPGKNLLVEVKGQRFKMTASGAGQNSIP